MTQTAPTRPTSATANARAVILLRQSDRLLTARRRFRDAAARLSGRLSGVAVRAAYITLTAASERSLEDTVKELIAAGAREIAVVPYQVEWANPHAYDVPDALYDLAEDYPDVTFRLGKPLGLAGDLDAVVASRIDEAWSLPRAGKATTQDIVQIAGQTPTTTATFTPGELPKLPTFRKHVFVCFGRRCMEQGSPETYAALNAHLVELGLATLAEGGGSIKVSRSKCLSPCQAAPVAVSYPDGTYTCGLTPDLIPTFVDEVIQGGRPLPGRSFRPLQ